MDTRAGTVKRITLASINKAPGPASSQSAWRSRTSSSPCADGREQNLIIATHGGMAISLGRRTFASWAATAVGVRATGCGGDYVMSRRRAWP
jgi:hypothetical protein